MLRLTLWPRVRVRVRSVGMSLMMRGSHRRVLAGGAGVSIVEGSVDLRVNWRQLPVRCRTSHPAILMRQLLSLRIGTRTAVLRRPGADFQIIEMVSLHELAHVLGRLLRHLSHSL